MKKVIVSMMVAVAMIGGGVAFAQTQADGATGATAKKECCKKAERGGKGEKFDKATGKKVKGEGKKPKFNPFEGVQLTEDQQQRLQVLRQGLGPVRLSQAQQDSIPVNPNLTPEQKAQLKAERKAQKIEKKKNYLNGVKEILTPEQYVVFLENCYIFTPEQGKKAHFGPKEKGKHKGGRGDKGVKAKERKAEN